MIAFLYKCKRETHPNKEIEWKNHPVGLTTFLEENIAEA